MRIQGACGCGAVTFVAEGEPIVQLYCHCRSCQIAHAAPFVAAAIFPEHAVRYEGDVRSATVTSRADAAKRIFCVACGTKLIVEPPPPVRTIFPALCTHTDWFRPTMHVQWQDRAIEVRDDLPKFLDYPTELGGTGRTA